MFKIKKYLLQLYKSLHPEDKTVTENELTDINIKSERYEAEQDKAKRTAIHLLKLGKMSLEDIAEATELSLDIVKELESQSMQLV